MTGLNQIVALGNGTVRACAGIRPADIETAARQTGWELRCMPSTYRLASPAVSTAAGSAVSAPSTMGRWRRRQCAQRQSDDRRAGPRVLTVPAPEALLLHHAYGTNGIITEVELALAPAHQWIERLDVFDDFADALNYANACVRSPGLVKRRGAAGHADR